MATLPNYRIIIQPRGDDSGLTTLHVTLTLENPQRQQGQLLCKFPAIPGHPPHRYSAANAAASDSNGTLDVVFTTQKDRSIEVNVNRDTVGDVILALNVTPRFVDELSIPVQWIELHRHQGGITGTGQWFLPYVPYMDRCIIHVEWDLSLSPPATNASWTCGDGPQLSTKDASMNFLMATVFMVGPIVSCQSDAPSTGSFGSGQVDAQDPTPRMHWFDELPGPLQVLRRSTAAVFWYARMIFEDPDAPMKVYIRKIPRSLRGYNFASCFIIDYSDADMPRELDVLHFMAHELTHNWAYLGDEPDGYQNMWFIEGVAELYALYMPVMAGVKGAEYFCTLLDGWLAMYYTSPFLTTPLREVPDDGKGASVQYQRGFMYFLLLDAQLRAVAERKGESTKAKIAVHSCVMEVCKRHWGDGDTDSLFWCKTLYPLLGKAAVDAGLADMMDGKVLKPDPQWTFSVAGKTIRLKEIEQVTIDVGFSDKSFDTRIIEGVVPGSKAELAGLREGDKLLMAPSTSRCLTDETATFSFTALRGDTKFQGEYDPRSSRTVPSYRTEILD